MKENLLTIITVTYNCEKLLQRTIDSVFNQDFTDYEYLIVDGGSTDNTISIIEANISKFNGRLRYISEPDNGLYDAMNKGICAARGKYIGMINGDDYYSSSIFKTVVDIFESKNTDVVYSDLIYASGDFINLKNPLKADHHKLRQRMSVNHPTCFVKKATYEKYGYFDIQYRIAADYELMARFFTNGCHFEKVPRVLAVMESGGLSSNNWMSIDEKYKIHRAYFGKAHALKYKIRNILIYFYRKTKHRYGGQSDN